MDSIIWAIKHTMRDIADTGLNCGYLRFRDLCFISIYSTSCHSVLGGSQQLLKRAGGRQQCLLPAVFPQYCSGYFLRLNRHGPQEWLQAAECTLGSHVPTRGDELDSDTLV